MINRKKMSCMEKEIKLVPYTDEDYEFVYKVKKNAYKKYVEECWGEWNEETQRQLFKRFIEKVKNNTFIIVCKDKKIGFYNGEFIDNGHYEKNYQMVCYHYNLCDIFNLCDSIF